MKKLLVLFAGILLNAAFFTTYADEQEKSPFMTRTFPASSIKEAEAVTMGGNLTLTGDAGSTAVVEVYVSRDDWPAEKIKQVLEDCYSMDIKVEKGKLYAVATLKKNTSDQNRQGLLSISFKISVPKQVNSNLQTDGGSIKVSNLSGSRNFKTSGGSLTVDNVSGSTVGSTSGGSITVTGSKGNIDLTTGGGSITAKDCSGKIDLTTCGGNLNMSNLSGNINATTGDGSITTSDIKGTFITGTSGGSVNLDGISGNLEAHTYGGSMNVKIKSASDYVKLSNFGNLNLTLPAGKSYNLNVKADNIEVSGLQDFRGTKDGKSIEGTVKGDGPEINVTSSHLLRLSFE